MKLNEYAKTHNIVTEDHWRHHFKENIRTGDGPVALYSCPTCHDIYFAPPYNCKCSKKTEDIIEEVSSKKAAHLEALAVAFIKETGLKPSEAVLVEERSENVITWYFRKREGFGKYG